MRPIPSPKTRRVRLSLALAALALVAAVVVALLVGGGPRTLPRPGVGRRPRAGDPFAYVPARQGDFEARAVAGSAHVLFAKSPGGALATAARVAAFRPLIDRAAAGSGIDPNVLEGIVFVESAGRPNVIAGTDPADASGLTQILAQTGQSLLGMRIKLRQSRRLTDQIGAAYAAGRANVAVALERRRARIDDRFDPAKALAATVRYLRLAERDLGRPDLAVVSYHMGIGNLQQVLHDYDGGRPVPYAQLFFDTSPGDHAAAYDLLAGFGDDSSLYYWRVLGAVQIMRLYRTDGAALARLAALQLDGDTNAWVLHPPNLTPAFASPNALYSAYASRVLVPLPSNPAQLGLAYGGSLGAFARRVGAPPALYRGLRPAALDLLLELAARVRALSGGAAPLILVGAVTDRQYEQQLINDYPAASTGYSFQIDRRYVSRAQAVAFQAMLDRLQALNLIAWERTPATIDITVSSDAAHAIADGP